MVVVAASRVVPLLESSGDRSLSLLSADQSGVQQQGSVVAWGPVPLKTTEWGELARPRVLGIPGKTGHFGSSNLEPRTTNHDPFVLFVYLIYFFLVINRLPLKWLTQEADAKNWSSPKHART